MHDHSPTPHKPIRDHQKIITDLIGKNRIFVFMKGEKDEPMCGFSALTVNILKNLGAQFQTFNVLQDHEIRQAIKDYTNWPTIPQVFIDGKFIGGSDILQELYAGGELKKMITADEKSN